VNAQLPLQAEDLLRQRPAHGPDPCGVLRVLVQVLVLDNQIRLMRFKRVFLSEEYSNRLLLIVIKCY